MFTVGFDGASKLTFQSLDTYNPTNDEEGKVDLRDPANAKAQFSVTKATGTGSSLQLQIGDTSDSYNQLSVSIQDIHASSLGIADISIATQSGAQAAIDKIKNAINTVSSVRGTLGATQNRLEHTSNNLSVMTENIQDAESTIRDTDIAEEMMSYTKNNILVQSAQAMLAQANSVPQGVLQLLQ
jgi:flagellin